MRRRVLDEAGWRCAKCGRAGPLELHHVTAVEDGGTDHPDNLIPLCAGCHLAAHNRKPGGGLAAARRAWRAEIARRLADQ